MVSNHRRPDLHLPLAASDTIRDFQMIQPEDGVLVGVSGGPDSVALLYVLRELTPRLDCRIGIAHLNHGLRGKEGNRDQRFVADLSTRLKLPFYTAKRDVRRYRRKHKLSTEEAARRVRYDFLSRTALGNRYNRIALGHHLDDNAEIVLLHILRGSGPQGLSGIPSCRECNGNRLTIIRPFINVYRSDITAYLEAGGIDYVLDRSNADLRYRRNQIRHELLPHLEATYNPKMIETLNRLSTITRSENLWIEEQISPLFNRIRGKKGRSCHHPVHSPAKGPPSRPAAPVDPQVDRNGKRQSAPHSF